MPEYLSPGVYVEEVNSGSKPIEGVSTSTTGAVGVAERGPENVPTLVTSPGEYARTFGGPLDFVDFRDPTGRSHAYLPYAVGGFFSNGGRRLYVTRVLPEAATRASRVLFDRGEAGAAATLLLRPAAQNSGTLVAGPPLYALDPASIAVGEFLRVGDGSRAEYRQVSAVGGTANHVAISFPLATAYDESAGVVLAALTFAPDASFGGFTLEANVGAGSTSFVLVEGVAGDAQTLATTASAGPVVLEVGALGTGELVTVPQGAVEHLGGARARVTLDFPLRIAAATAQARVVDTSAALPATPLLALDANAGDLLLYASDSSTLAPAALPAIRLVALAQGGVIQEVQRVGQLARFDLDLGAGADYPAQTPVRLVTLGDDALTVANPPVPTTQVFEVAAIGRVEAGSRVLIGTEEVIVQSVFGNLVTLTTALPAAPALGDTVTPVSALSAPAAASSVVLALDNRVGLEADDVLRLGSFPDEEFVTVVQVQGPRNVGPDAGNVIVSAPLRRSYATGTRVTPQADPTYDTTRQPAFTALSSLEGDLSLLVNDGRGFAQDEYVVVELASGARYYHRLTDVDATLAPGPVELGQALEWTHEPGSPLFERSPLLEVRALDRGGWGNRLRIAVEDEESGLVAQSEIAAVNSGLELRLSNVTGVEAGTVLEMVDPATGVAIEPLLKVRSVDRANRLVTLDPPGVLPSPPIGTRIRSREFRMSVFLLRRPDPAVPSRDELLEDTEVFRLLSMDVRHSRYVQRVIGATFDPAAGTFRDDGDPGSAEGSPLRLSDLRSAGGSAYVRVLDGAPDRATAEEIRLGPEALVDVLPSGRERGARHRLTGGGDSVATMGDAMYVGTDHPEPRLRTGIFALANIQDISIVAVPGQTTVPVQQALIDHAELSRYRFVVLDAPGPNNDSLADVLAQRQQFDTTYAALYHPWLTIRDPLPANLADVRDIAIPPSLHIAGIYARTDVERGVHKAPANEVVRGITGLTRSLNKGEHDVLNPFPKNIDVIRDFRVDNRGIRVWGARVITSDSDYKYVNVRRLLIFIEASIDRGVQWVVFEPNGEELWGRVRRAVTNFLTVVWRNGGLEGSTPEQGFFVKCDRTTMTQQDIDNGRLICVVGVAPVKPAEFVIVRIGLWTADSQQ
jgi:phage tail sheath protein FI